MAGWARAREHRGAPPSTAEDERHARWGRRGAFVALGLLLAVLLAGCGGGDDEGASEVEQPTEGQPVSGGKIVFGLNEDPDGFNPAENNVGFASQSMMKAMFDPIAVFDEEGIAQPYLVEGFEPNDDFTEWTITMRDEDIKFHNGDTLTPQMLATHLKTMQLAPLTFFTFKPLDAVGVVDEAARPRFEAGELSEEEYDVLRRQVIVTMTEPWSTFPAFLASYQVGYMVHPDYVAGQIEEPMGTGPFTFEEWVPGDHLTTRRNPDYWRDGLPYLDEVEFRVLTDPGSRYESLSAGDLDLMVTNSPTQVAELGVELPDDQILLQEQGAGDEEFVLFNTQSGPTSDVRVRQALQLATDREAINDLLYDGYFEIAEAPYAESSDWYTDPGWPELDVAEATRLVEEWEAENGPLTINLTTFNTQDDLELGQALQAQWGEAGIDTNIESTTESATAEAIPFGNYEASLTHLFGGSDPDEHYPFWDPDEENIGGPGELSINFSRYTSDTTRDALHLGRQTADVDERRAAYADVWKDWAENVPYLWLYHKPQVLVASDQVNGLETFSLPNGDPADSFVGGSLFPTELWRE